MVTVSHLLQTLAPFIKDNKCNLEKKDGYNNVLKQVLQTNQDCYYTHGDMKQN